jgi:hypothetical protein
MPIISPSFDVRGADYDSVNQVGSKDPNASLELSYGS